MVLFCLGMLFIVGGALAVAIHGPLAAVATFLFCGLVCIIAGGRSVGNKWEKERVEAILKNIRREHYFEYGPEVYHQEHEYLQELEIDRYTNLY